VLRYRTGELDDGLSGKEGTFVICSFWLVSAPLGESWTSASSSSRR
jgi:hypothetical protein